MIDSAEDGPAWDFFVSYTQADRAWAEWIAWLLEADGHRVLVQAWDMVPGSNWIKGMDHGVARAARTVAVLSPDYLSSVYGMAEWQAAFADDPQGLRCKLITVRVRGDWPPGLLAGVVGIDLVDLSEDAAQQRLREGVAAAVRGRTKPDSPPPFPLTGRAAPTEPRFPGALPEVFTVPGRNPHFTGRAAELDTIRAGLSAGTTMTVHAVHGLGGVGKTQTVIEYAHRNASAYDLVWWINAEQPTLITSQLATLAEPLGLPPDPNPDAEVRAVCAELRRRASALTDDQADALAELLGDLPLALEQAAAYLDQTQLPPVDYLNLLTTRAADLYGRGRVVDHQHTIATLWSLSLDQLRVAQPAAVQLLSLCAYLAPEPIPLNLFTNHPNQLPAPLNHVASDPLAFAETVGALVDYSLARRTEAGLLLHRLVQAVIRQPDPNQPLDPHPLTVVLSLLHADLPVEISTAPWSCLRWYQLGHHVLATGQLQLGLRQEADQTIFGFHHPPSATILNTWGFVLLRIGQASTSRIRLEHARDALEHALRLTVASYGPDHLRTAGILSNLAETQSELGAQAAARTMYERALHIFETAYGPDHPASVHVRRALHELGNTPE